MSSPQQMDPPLPFYAPAKIRLSDPAYLLQCRSGGSPSRADASPPRSGGDKGPCTVNIMYDRRVVRGNTYALRPKSAPEADEATSPKFRCGRQFAAL